MARFRLGKRERAERKAQWALVKAAKSAVITENQSTPVSQFDTSRGYRTVNLMEGYAFHGASNMARPDMEGANGWGKARPLRPGTGSYRK